MRTVHLAVLLLAGSLFAQTLSFEVASVKPVDPDIRQGIDMKTFPGGRLVATEVTLQQLIEAAFMIDGYRIQGGPAWLGSDRFDITASAGQDVSNIGDTVMAAGRPAPRRMMLM